MELDVVVQVGIPALTWLMNPCYRVILFPLLKNPKKARCGGSQMWWQHFGWRLRQEGSCEFKAVSELRSEFQTSLDYRVESHLSKPTNKSNNDNKILPKVKFKSVLDNTQGVTKETSAKKIKMVEERRLYLWRKQEKDPEDIWETLRQSLWGLCLPARHWDVICCAVLPVDSVPWVSVQCVPAQSVSLCPNCETCRSTSRSAVTLKVEPVSLGAVYVVPFAEDELSAQAVGKGTVQSPLDLGWISQSKGLRQEFLTESAHGRAFRMTLANYGIRMLWRLPAL